MNVRRGEASSVSCEKMNIVVCVKAVPASTEVKMDPRTNTIVRDGAAAVVNPFDAAALEAALQLADERAAQNAEGETRVSVLSMGIPATESLLSDCIARGATDALLLSDRAFAGADTLATTYALTCGLQTLGDTPDLVMCGKMAVDGDTAQIGPEIAGALDVPCVTDVREIVSCADGVLTVRCGTDEGTATMEVALPAVITVSKDIAQLRMPTIAGVRAGEAAQVRVLDAAAADADTSRCGLVGSPTQVLRSFVPERATGAVDVAGDVPQQANELLQIIEGMGL